MGTQIIKGLPYTLPNISEWEEARWPQSRLKYNSLGIKVAGTIKETKSGNY